LDNQSKECLEKAMGVDDAVVFEELPQIKIKFRESKVFKPIIDDIH